MKVSVILCLIILLENTFTKKDECVEKKNTAKEDEEEFKPTNEWQKIKPGQVIPRGLHVRLNIWTGEREAKLLTEETDENHSETDKPFCDCDKSDENGFCDKSCSKTGYSGSNNNYALSNSYLSVEDSWAERHSNNHEKQILNNVDVNAKTVIELVQDALLKLKEKITSSDIDYDDYLTLLLDVEYLVHQYDNAKEFARFGGILEVIFPLLNSTSPEVRAEATHVLGSAAQNNPDVKEAIIQDGGLQVLLKVLALDIDCKVRIKALYSLSCLLRNFPIAQAQFIKSGGLTVFAEIFDKTSKLDLRMKITDLISDIVQEKNDVIVQESSNCENQINDTDFEIMLVNLDWCKRISNLLIQSSNFLDRDGNAEKIFVCGRLKSVPEEHLVLEKLITSVLSLGKTCSSEFRRNRDLSNALAQLSERYSVMAKKEQECCNGDHIKYFTHLADLVQQALNVVNFASY